MRTAIVAMIALLCAFETAAGAEAECFNRDDNPNLKGWFIREAAAPPTSPGSTQPVEHYGAYPGNMYVSHERRQGDAVVWLQANGCVLLKESSSMDAAPDCASKTLPGVADKDFLRLPDPASAGKTLALRPVFTTYELADECTMLQAGRILGEQKPFARNSRLALWDETAAHEPQEVDALLARALDAPAFTGSHDRLVADVCRLPLAIPSATTLLLDYEMLDGHRPEQTLALVKQLSDRTKIQGKKLFFLTNDVVVGDKNGVDMASIQKIMAMVDGFLPSIAPLPVPTAGLPAQTIVQDYADQLWIITHHNKDPIGPELRAKIIPVLRVGDMNLAEARAFHGAFESQEYGGIFLRAGSEAGGVCETPQNQITGCLAFGYCDGNMHR